MGRVFIYSEDTEKAVKAYEIILDIVRDIEPGQIHIGKIVRLVPFGAFIDVGKGKEGLLHISKFSKKRVNKPEDMFKVGDEVEVKVTKVDEQGKIDLTRIGLEPEEEGEEAAEGVAKEEAVVKEEKVVKNKRRGIGRRKKED